MQAQCPSDGDYSDDVILSAIRHAQLATDYDLNLLRGVTDPLSIDEVVDRINLCIDNPLFIFFMLSFVFSIIMARR